MNWLLIGGLGLLVVSVLLFVGSRRLRKRTGLPGGRVIYSDTRTWQACPEPLYAPSVNLVGKPDYVVTKWKYAIPIEVKSCHAPAEPYYSHVLQLAAYCLLIEETYDQRPPYGLIHYPERTFAVKYTSELEGELLSTIEWMREDMRAQDVDRDHNDPVRCQACGYGEYCDQRLA